VRVLGDGNHAARQHAMVVVVVIVVVVHDHEPLVVLVDGHAANGTARCGTKGRRRRRRNPRGAVAVATSVAVAGVAGGSAGTAVKEKPRQAKVVQEAPKLPPLVRRNHGGFQDRIGGILDPLGAQKVDHDLHQLRVVVQKDAALVVQAAHERVAVAASSAATSSTAASSTAATSRVPVVVAILPRVVLAVGILGKDAGKEGIVGSLAQRAAPCL